MPKLITKSEDKVKRLLISNLEYECSIRGIDLKRQTIIAQCTLPTYNKKRKDPGNFTVNELLRFANKLNIKIETLFMEKQINSPI